MPKETTLPNTAEATTYTKPRERVIHAPDGRMPDPSSQQSKTITNSVRIADGSPQVDAPVPTTVVSETVVEGSSRSSRAQEAWEIKKTVKFNYSLSPCDCCPVDANEADVFDIGREQLNEVAIENYCCWYGLPLGAVTMAQVRDTSARITG